MDVRMMLAQDVHVLDEARLQRLKARIERDRHTTPMQRQEILSLENQEDD